ncbi:hypothetical protein ACP4OV_020861 [Aristida adscensionis]
MADLAAFSVFFGAGSFVALMGHLLWLGVFNLGVVLCAIGITVLPQQSVFYNLSHCSAGPHVYTDMYLTGGAAIFAVLVQCLLASCAKLIVGSEEKIDELNAPTSHLWCRRVVFAAVVTNAVTSACVIWLINCILFIRVGTFKCLGGGIYLVIVGDALAGFLGTGFTLAASYVANYAP